MQKVIGYLRVSTMKQGIDGLGMAAQEKAVLDYVAATGGKLLVMFTEVETGKRAHLENRPELKKALAHAKRAKATLVVAKLDRLTRSVAVTSALHESGVDFVACDNPNANRLTIQILAAVAENEARVISERTKAALAAAKARGTLLGASRPTSRNLTPEAGVLGAQRSAMARRERAVKMYEDLIPEVGAMRAAGKTLRAIAATLNTMGYTTSRGAAWNATQVLRLTAMA